MKHKNLLAITVCLLIAAMGYSQSKTTPWAVGFGTGKTAYKGDLGNGMFKFDEAYHGFGGLKLARYLNSYLDLNLDGTYGRIGYNNNKGGSFLAHRLHMDLNLAFKFANGKWLREDAQIAPYLYGGLGFINYNPVDNRSTEGTDLLIPLGVGTKVRINDRWSAFWQSSYNFTNGDVADMMVGDEFTSEMIDKNDHNLMHQIGVSFSFGQGVKQDMDKDGIPDDEDRCPMDFGLKSTQGCPDTDLDGIIDSEDSCPNDKGPRSMDGCPDGDQDGVADKLDVCPTIKGVLSNNGCPEIPATTIRLFEEALQGIQFETSKSVIKPSSFAILDRVVQVMNKNQYYNLSIEGHTDSSGDDAMNMQLSKERAASVKSYLVSKGVSGNRMSTVGFGETKPVATNDTKEGMTLNRRVEFKVKF